MKRIGIVLIACIMLFLVGCNGEEAPIPGGTPFIGGTQGLTMQFDNSPPAEVYDGGTFPFEIMIKLQNKGEWDVDSNKARVSISGILPDQFSLQASDLVKAAPEDLPKVQKDPSGNIVDSPPIIVEFPGFNHKDSITGAELSYPVRADVCYNYGTQAVAQLCVRENILSPKGGGVCTINEAKTVYNSGAPVQVSTLIESPRASNKIGFTFTVQHSGTGDIYEQETLCNKESRAFEDKVYVKVDSGVEGIECSSLEGGTEGFVKLFGGSKPISCTLTIPNPGDYKVPIYITLGYDYEIGQSTQIVVKNIGE